MRISPALLALSKCELFVIIWFEIHVVCIHDSFSFCCLYLSVLLFMFSVSGSLLCAFIHMPHAENPNIDIWVAQQQELQKNGRHSCSICHAKRYTHIRFDGPGFICAHFWIHTFAARADDGPFSGFFWMPDAYIDNFFYLLKLNPVCIL